MSYASAMAKSVFSNSMAGPETGPTGWLTTATNFNGTTDQLDTAITLASLGSSYAIAVWCKVNVGQNQANTDNIIFGTDQESLFYSWGHSNAAYRGVVGLRDGGGTYRTGGGDIVINTDVWKLYGTVVTGGTTRTILDGVQVASIPYVPGFALTDLVQFGTSIDSSSRRTSGKFAGAVVLAGGTVADLAEIYAGPEPINTIPPTLSSEGDWTAGSWDSQGNGSITYTVTLQKDSITVATIQNLSATASGNILPYIAMNNPGDYNIVVSASNNGGNDNTQDTSSNIISSEYITSYNSTSVTQAFRASLQDNEDNTTILAEVGSNAILSGGSNTEDISTSGPGKEYPLALTFNGSSDFITSSYTRSGDFTLGIWVKRDGIDNAEYSSLFSSTSGTGSGTWQFDVNGSGSYRVVTNAVFNNLSISESDTWRHLAIRYTASPLNFEVFINGIVADSFTPSESLAIANMIFMSNRVGNSLYKGSIAGITAYNNLLSDSNILEIVNGPEPINITPPTLDIYGNWSAGSWDSQDNGDIIYDVRLIKDSIEVAILSGSSGFINFASFGEGVFKLEVSTTNDGGNDILQNQVSNEVEFILDDLNLARYVEKNKSFSYSITKSLYEANDEFQKDVMAVSLKDFIEKENYDIPSKSRDFNFLNKFKRKKR